LSDKTGQTLTLHRYGTNKQCGTLQRSDVVNGVGAGSSRLEMNSSGDDIILILIVRCVCYRTIAGGSSQHKCRSAVWLVCCSKWA